MSSKQPDWIWPELVVTAAVQDAAGWGRTIRSTDDRVIELSNLFRDLNPLLAKDPRFRSAASLQRKLEDLRTVHPKYVGTKTRGGRLTAAVVTAYVQDPGRMRGLAERFRNEPRLLPHAIGLDVEDDVVDLDEVNAGRAVSAVEGAVRRRIATYRERDPKLRGEKIAEAVRQRGRLECETCSFDFEARYGELGSGYAHVHHIVPLHVTNEVENSLSDLVVLCANCHAMIHRRRPWKTPKQLVEIICKAEDDGVTR
ncbi:HNH endonuclease [Gordonia sp. HY285]|uniref:HNH endonuclease n=1 Tax=Gordonia liuliyuniae TaxID=2911517 RepID=UPI001F0053EE|nr:HNH endonuclease [Gordonia liuliyuniae]MCF8611521.1 HNH endonuclease [Gordonia liuliyuniae]